MKKINFQKGFTLIELLVVVAIIGILASVVLSSLNTARAKGADAAIKANLANIRVQAELIYDTNTPNSYDNVCTNEVVVSQLSAASKALGGDFAPGPSIAGTSMTVVCHESADNKSWAAGSGLKAEEGVNSWCVDSTGVAKLVLADFLDANESKCP